MLAGRGRAGAARAGTTWQLLRARWPPCRLPPALEGAMGQGEPREGEGAAMAEARTLKQERKCGERLPGEEEEGEDGGRPAPLKKAKLPGSEREELDCEAERCCSVGPALPIVNNHVAAAWAHFRKLGSPKFHVAPMVDQSELPFRLLCRRYGADAAYTPMLHSRLYAEDPKYRREFTTCEEDRPLFVQFCGNNPETLLAAGKLVAPFADYVDINLGCPQRIAKRGYYGSFLMDNLPLVRSLVRELADNLPVPVSCKIRVFPTREETLAYALMLEEAGCSLLAVHGRTRDQKNQKATRADWTIIRAVKEALQIPVLANGNVRWLEDAEDCMRETGVDGVMSAESLLENPALFGGFRMPRSGGGEEENGGPGKPDQISLMLEYLDLVDKHPVPPRMVRAHVHKLLGCWFRVHQDIRERLNKEVKITTQWLRELVLEMAERNRADPSLRPLPDPPEKRAAAPPSGDAAAAPPAVQEAAGSEPRHGGGREASGAASGDGCGCEARGVHPVNSTVENGGAIGLDEAVDYGGKAWSAVQAGGGAAAGRGGHGGAVDALADKSQAAALVNG